MMEITGRTALLAILADPVAQAPAAGLVNAALASRGCDAVLVSLRVASEALERVAAGDRQLRGDARGTTRCRPNTLTLDRGAVAAQIVISETATPFSRGDPRAAPSTSASRCLERRST
jgi:hypothetical protein